MKVPLLAAVALLVALLPPATAQLDGTAAALEAIAGNCVPDGPAPPGAECEAAVMALPGAASGDATALADDVPCATAPDPAACILDTVNGAIETVNAQVEAALEQVNTLVAETLSAPLPIADPGTEAQLAIDPSFESVENGAPGAAYGVTNADGVAVEGARVTSPVRSGSHAIRLSGYDGGHDYGIMRAVPGARLADLGAIEVSVYVPTGQPNAKLNVYFALEEPAAYQGIGCLASEAITVTTKDAWVTVRWDSAAIFKGGKLTNCSFFSGYAGSGMGFGGNQPLSYWRNTLGAVPLRSVTVQPNMSSGHFFVDDFSFAGEPAFPVGDGFVARFNLPFPAGGPGGDGAPFAPYPVALLEDALEITVSPGWGARDVYAPYTGRLTLYAQRDCGALTAVLGMVDEALCQTLTTVASQTLTGPNNLDGAYTFTLTAAELADGFVDGLPATALHFFVESDDPLAASGHRYSSYHASKDLLVGSFDGKADLFEGAFGFTPVILLAEQTPLEDAGDGFIASYDWSEHLETPAGVYVQPTDGAFQVKVRAYDLDAPIAGRTMLLRAAIVADPVDGCPAGYTEVAANPAACYATLDSAVADAEGDLTFDVLASTLQAGRPGNGVDLFVIGESLSRSSHYFYPKNQLVVAAAGDPTLLAAIDALEEGGVATVAQPATPVFVGSVGDGFITRITPARADTSAAPAFTTMTPDNRGNYIFTVDAFDATGAAYGFVDWRVEIIGLDPAGYDPANPAWAPVLYEVGSYGGSEARQSAVANDGDNALTFRVPASQLRNSADGSLPNAVGVLFFISHAPGGLSSSYSEVVNALLADPTEENAALADQVDSVAVTPIVLRAPATPAPPCDPGAGTCAPDADGDGVPDAADRCAGADDLDTDACALPAGLPPGCDPFAPASCIPAGIPPPLLDPCPSDWDPLSLEPCQPDPLAAVGIVLAIVDDALALVAGTIEDLPLP